MNLEQIKQIEKSLECLYLHFLSAEINEYIGGKLVYTFDICGDIIGIVQLSEVLSKVTPENYQVLIDFGRKQFLFINN